MMPRFLPVLLVGLMMASAGCLGTTTRRLCVDEASSSGSQATIRTSSDGTFTYADPQGLVNANWQGRGMYLVTVGNDVVTQTLKGFSRDGSCPIVG